MVARQRLPLVVGVILVSLFLGLARAHADSNPPTFVPDQILVKFQPGTPASEMARAHASAQSVIRDEIPQIGVQIIGLPPGLSVGQAIGFYEHNPNVEFVEPDYYVEPVLVPNDPWYQNWQIGLQLMGAPEAWDITTGISSVMIAVLDTGVDFDHPDLQGRLLAGWDFAENDADPTDAHGHGTHVIGVLGAATNNGEGIAGVSWQNPVLCVRIAGYSGTTTWSKIAQGITYATDAGARAINISFAGTGYSSSVASAVEYAWGKGSVTVAAAGNSAASIPYYPAALPHVVGVSGIDGRDQLEQYSNYGPWIDVCARAGSMTTSLGGNYNGIGGTSISAPFVTGLFGLVFSADPHLTPQQGVDIVCGTAIDLGEPGFDEYYGWGKIDLYEAVLAAAEAADGTDTTPPTASIISPSGGDALSGTVTVTASVTDNVAVTEVELHIDDSLAGWVVNPPYSWTWHTTSYSDGAHVLVLKAYDVAGNMGASAPVTVTLDNSPPSAAISDPQDGAAVGGITSVCAEASDGTTSVREVRFYLDGAWQETVPAAPYVWSWDTTNSSQGWHSLVARAFDAAGNEGASTAVSVEVTNGSDPAETTETFTGRVGFAKQADTQAHAISVGAPGLISASLTWGGKADLDLYLYSSTGALIASATTSGRGGSEQISYQAADGGTYFLEVVAVSGKANYTLTVTHT